MGRTPDYMNVTFAGFADDRTRWAGPDGRNEEGYENLVAFQKRLRRDDLSLTHTIIHPTVDKAKDSNFADNPVPLHKVGETADSIIVRGCRLLATLAPYADEQTVYPAQPLPPGATNYALSFTVAMDAPGLVFVCRDSAIRPNADPVDAPFSTRFDEQDALCIFDNVEIPKRNVFIDGDLDVYNKVMGRSPWSPNIMQQTTIRALTKLEFAYGLLVRMAEAVNDTSERTMEMLGEVLGYIEVTRNAILLAELNATTWEDGGVYPENRALHPMQRPAPRLVHPRQRHHQDRRQSQPARRGQQRSTRQPPDQRVDERVPARSERDLRQCPLRGLSSRLGLHRVVARQPQRTVRTQLPHLGQDQPDASSAELLRGKPPTRQRTRRQTPRRRPRPLTTCLTFRPRQPTSMNE